MEIYASDIPNDHQYPLRKKSEEIGVFGAEKYFNGEIEDGDIKNDLRFIDTSYTKSKMHQQDKEIEGFDQINVCTPSVRSNVSCNNRSGLLKNDLRFIATSDTKSKMHQQDEKTKEFDHSFPVKQRFDQINVRTPSVRSNVSCNSRKGLLPRAKQAPEKIKKGSKTRNFLATFVCNCINKNSTNPHTGMFDFDKKTDSLSSKLAENNAISFPVLNSNDLNSNSKSGNLAGKAQGDNNGGRLTLGRKLSLLNNWNVDIKTEGEMYIPSSGMYNNEVDSDSSSDLFEIGSFSTTGNSSFLGHRTSESNCYAPSEVSVDWSVVTASAADFSDYEEVKTCGGGRRNSGRNAQVTENKNVQKKPPVIRSGRAPGGRRRRLLDSMAIGLEVCFVGE